MEGGMDDVHPDAGVQDRQQGHRKNDLPVASSQYHAPFNNE